MYDTVEYRKLNEKLYVYTHSSGLKTYLIQKKGYQKKYATFATNYGSIDNRFIRPGDTEITEVPNGIAHFLEHKLFEQKDGSVMDKFAYLGSSPNAYTGFNQTVYLFSCTDKFYENFKLLLDFVQHPYLTEESIEKEKGIIGQEIRMYEDNPDWRVFFNLLRALYKYHPVRIDIAGSLESISKINKENLYMCYNTFYHPSNMMILVVGDLEPESIFEQVDNLIENKDETGKIKRIFPDEPKEINKDYVEQKLSVSMPMFQLGFKDNAGFEGHELLKRFIVIRMALSIIAGRSSKLYNELYEEGLINQTFGVDCTMEPNYGFSILGGQSNDPVKAKEKIIQKIREITEEGMDKRAFERMRRSFEGSFIRKLNSVEEISHEFISMFFKNANFFDIFKVFEEINYDEAQSIVKEHFRNEPALSVVLPA